MKIIRSTVEATRRKLSDIRAVVTRRSPRGGSHASPMLGEGDPTLDAIGGNDNGNEIWGSEGVPGRGRIRTCEDGDTQLLFQPGEEAGIETVSSDLTTFNFVGAQFEHHSCTRQPAIEQSDTRDERKLEVIDAEKSLIEMDLSLRKKSLEPFQGSGYYIPIKSLRSIVTLEAIKRVLPCIVNVSNSELASLAEDIYGRLEGGHHPAKSFRRIFAVLILIGKAGSIIDFVKAGITDAKLPLHRLGHGRLFQLCFADSNQPIELFQGWELRHVENFESTQWETLAPFFSSAPNEGHSVRCYKLTSWHPLPFDIIPESGCMGSSAKKPASGSSGTGSDTSLDSMKGGHGKVWKVRVNKDHYHSLPSYRGNEDNPSLAIKKLFAANKEAFKNEVDILTRLNRCNDPHLVKLLLTMEILGRPGKDTQFFLIFPLADSNLRQFWQRNFPHPSGTSTVAYARWVAKQLHGLAWALCKLHDLHQREVVEDSDSSDPFYGIHGDIKPENLLWYKEWVGPDGQQPSHNARVAQEGQVPQGGSKSLGVLQLADFGISRLHHTDSRSNGYMHKSTRTYAPPEIEWATNGFSRSFDIWSLGCVFLEFICWLVQGGSGKENPVDVFHEERYLERANRSLEGTIQDTFYYVVKQKDKTEFDVNPAVKKLITTLKRAEGSSLFVHEILDIILYKMLVVLKPKSTSKALKLGSKSRENMFSDDARRIDCLNLAKALDKIIEKGREDRYFIESPPKPQRLLTRAVTIHESANEMVKKKRQAERSFSMGLETKGHSAKKEQRPRKSTIHEAAGPS